MKLDELKMMIRRQGDAYHEALLRHGVEFFGRSPVARVPKVQKWLTENPAEPGHCYRNAQYMCLAGVADAHYHEGYRSSGSGYAVHHAWVVLDGEVIDPTAEAAGRVLKGFGIVPADPSDDAYLGIPVPTGFLRDRLARTEVWCPVAGAYLTSLGTPVQHPAGNTLYL